MRPIVRICAIPALLLHLSGSAAVVPRPVETGKNLIMVPAGAMKADDAARNTSAIQDALDKATQTGGIVSIPAGRYLCGPLRIHSRTELRLDSGTVLALRNDIEMYPTDEERYLNFLTIDSKAMDVRISGRGTIDGQGAIWWERFTSKTISKRRPQMLSGQGVQRLEISGVRFLNPPNTHISLKDCSEVAIRGIRIEAPERSRNTDGINISARNCLIEDCDIATGDDNIAINFGGRNFSPEHPECENIEIRNCRFGHGHGLSVGSFTSGHLRGLDVHDCSFKGTTVAIRIKSARGRGGIVQDLSYRNLKVEGSKWPVFISAYYPKEPLETETQPAPEAPFSPEYRNIRISGLDVTGGTEALRLFGLPEAPIDGIRFENCRFAARKGMRISNAKKVVFENCTLDVEQGARIETVNAEVSGISN